MRPQHPGQQPDQAGEHDTIGPVQPRLGAPAAQQSVLAPQDQDLRVLGRWSS